MARTEAQIKLSITADFISKAQVIALYGLQAGLTFLQQFSLVSLENNLFDTVSHAIWNLESLWDIYKAEALAEMSLQKVHGKEWYRQKALGYLFGVPVIPDTDIFDITGLTDEDILAAKVINQAAAVKMISNNGYGMLRIKVATANAFGVLGPLPQQQLTAFIAYMNRHAIDAGTQVHMTTGPADDLKLVIDVYYDALILSTTGARLDGTDATPVQDAANNYLGGLQFNGRYIKGDHAATLRKVPGVVTANIVSAASKYGNFNYTDTDVANVGPINEVRIADSGYMKIDQDAFVINFINISE